jgi:hypothetical protein
MEAAAERGLLDLSVELSTGDIRAGNHFAIFVIIKNPFDKPVWLYPARVSLPIELELTSEDELKKVRKVIRESEKQQNISKDEQSKILQNINDLKSHLNHLNNALKDKDGSNDNVNGLAEELTSKIDTMEQDLRKSYLGEAQIHIGGSANVRNITIGSRSTQVYVAGSGPDGQANIDDINVYDPWVVYEENRQAETKTRTIELTSSLPENTALQPGSTVVQTAILRVKRSVFFTPAAYRLQFNINYSFQPKVRQEAKNSELTENSRHDDGMLFANTIPFQITIRQSVHYMILGSAIGGLVGAIARLLQISPVASWQDFIINQLTFTNILVQLPKMAVPIAIAMILSGVAVIFTARKSDAQSFVSVEDFWGSLLIGFLIGYTGTSFFEKLTGHTPGPP